MQEQSHWIERLPPDVQQRSDVMVVAIGDLYRQSKSVSHDRSEKPALPGMLGRLPLPMGVAVSLLLVILRPDLAVKVLEKWLGL